MLSHKWIVVDLDGTLCNTDHRVHHAKAGQWDEFNSLCTQDTVDIPVLELMRSMEYYGYGVLIITGRDEKYRKQTTDWLIKHHVFPEHLLMRGAVDRRPDYEVKLEEIEKFFGDKDAALEQVLFCLDDREKVVQALRDYGLKVLQVKNGDY